MATRQRPAHRGCSHGMRLLAEFTAEFRAARHASGLSQNAVAQVSSMSRSSIERLELGKLTSLSVVQAAELAAIVGLDMVLRNVRWAIEAA